jgi:hypothetical protein
MPSDEEDQTARAWAETERVLKSAAEQIVAIGHRYRCRDVTAYAHELGDQGVILRIYLESLRVTPAASFVRPGPTLVSVKRPAPASTKTPVPARRARVRAR